MASKSGLPTIRETAQFLCTFMSIWIPVARKLFPDDDSLHTALEALRLAACTVVVEVDAVLPVGD